MQLEIAEISRKRVRECQQTKKFNYQYHGKKKYLEVKDLPLVFSTKIQVKTNLKYPLVCSLPASFDMFSCVFLQQQKTGVDKRECCLLEIRQTEEKYSGTLESILQVCTFTI